MTSFTHFGLGVMSPQLSILISIDCFSLLDMSIRPNVRLRKGRPKQYFLAFHRSRIIKENFKPIQCLHTDIIDGKVYIINPAI